MPDIKKSVPKSHIIYFIITLVFLVAVVVMRIHFLPLPLERDEGEYALVGQQILDGIPPFQESCNMKLPGIYVAYAVILRVFGQTSVGIHLGLIFVNVCCAALLFLLGKRLYGFRAGCMAAIAYSLMTLSSTVLGLSANAEHFVVLFCVSGLLLLLRSIDKKDNRVLFLSGILLGTGFLMKQHGAAFILCAVIVLCIDAIRSGFSDWKKQSLRFMLFGAGVVIPFAIVCLWLWRAGVFGQFWFWTFTYGQSYVSQVPLLQGLKGFNSTIADILLSTWPFWVLAAAGWIGLIRDKKLQTNRSFIVAFVIVSFVSICPGLFFRQHYFILLLPAIALLSGSGFVGLCNLLERRIQFSAVSVILFLCVSIGAAGVLYHQERMLFKTASPAVVSHLIYGENPFPESCVIADSLRVWTKPGDKIAVIGSEPQILFYAHRHSASHFIYAYPLMEVHPFASTMQHDMEKEIETAAPQYLVYVNISVSWLPKPKSDMGIFDWYIRYRKENYTPLGVADIISPDKTIYKWKAAADSYEVQSQYWVGVYKRK